MAIPCSTTPTKRFGPRLADQAPLVDTGAGVVPQDEGWFVVNARDAAWLRHDDFGARCTFEADGRVVQESPGLHVQHHAQLGVRLHVLEPGKPSTLYHRESNQEGFLVLSGECLLLVEGEERPLRAWDYFHCPAGTSHSFVGAGDGPCVMLTVGARSEGTILYPRDETALRHSAGVEEDTPSPRDAYAPFGHWRLGPSALS
jgi:uncharacterized cupin superfamily protein